VAEWLRSGLQSRLHRFDSGRRLSGARVVASAAVRSLPPRGHCVTRTPRQTRTAAVFGGNSEIAIATVEALAADGLERVVLAVRDPTAATAADAAATLRAQGLHVRVIAFDADATNTHEAAVDAAFAAIAGHGDGNGDGDRAGQKPATDLDVAIVAFGVLGDQAEAKRDAGVAVRLAHTNFTGAVSVLTILGERLRRQGHGAIVVLSSVAAERARQANYPYGATKAGLDAFAQGLGDALAPAGVHVLVARPGWVRTKMTAGRAAAPLATDAQHVGRDIAAGLRRGAHTVWSPRTLRFVFAAMRNLPRPLLRRIRC
jgi:decaprenylphospho-beta-D-erythro-pentofuranosid-2-ulose 2-reductase